MMLLTRSMSWCWSRSRCSSSSRSSSSMSPSTTLSLISLILLILNFTSAERDFNFNESQVPLLEPKDEPRRARLNQEDPYAIELTRCNYADNEIILSLVLKEHDWTDVSENKKAKVLEKLSKFFAIPKEFIAMESVTKKELNDMQKEAIRKGNNKSHSSRHLGRANLVIGCGPAYFSMGEPIANQIGYQMKDGSIDNITGEKFGWWVIWRKYNKAKAERIRRDVEGSGEVDDYGDDYEYGDEEEEETEANEPVTVLPATTTHAHRHRHGQDENAVNTLQPEQNAALPTTPQQSSSSVDSSLTPTATSNLFEPTTTSTTSTMPTTEYIEPKVENNAPIIKTRLQKFAVTSGKLFSFKIPAETFYDIEDAGNLRLQLTNVESHELKSTSWLQFNADKREIYGLPLDDSVSKWQYLLSATDSGNATVTETVEISVQQHRGVRSVNHEISIGVKFNEKHARHIDWQIKLMKAIAKTLDDNSTNSIVVREIRQIVQDPNAATFVYFNESLPSSECPESELNELIKRLDASRLSDLVYPMLGIVSITGQLVGPCQKLIHTSKTKPTTFTTKNLPPMPRNQVDRVNATVGHLLVFKVPGDTFFDPNDDGELTLTLKTKDHKEISPRHWLQFDTKNQEFYGIPKGGDIGSEEYLLVAEDAGGLSATDALVVVVNHAPKKEFSAYFKAYLGIRHEQFNADLQRKFVERIAQLFGDQSPHLIQIRSVTTHHDFDSTIVNFYNTTLFKSHNRCPEKQIEAARSVYLMHDGTVRDRIKKALGAELNLTKVEVPMLGSCHQQPDVPHREFPNLKTEEPTQKSAFGDNYMFTFVYPAIIIIAMIIIAAIIACCLHRRRRKSGKMELGDDEERKSFRAKGIPVIFQDELDEKPEVGNKSPIILKDEKPPLLPPSYNQLNMNGDNDVDEYVPPPAVVVGGREARGKSPATPSYRKPPPYVSP